MNFVNPLGRSAVLLQPEMTMIIVSIVDAIALKAVHIVLEIMSQR